MILTKSISRFGRNTVILLESVRELRTLGVDAVSYTHLDVYKRQAQHRHGRADLPRAGVRRRAYGNVHSHGEQQYHHRLRTVRLHHVEPGHYQRRVSGRVSGHIRQPLPRGRHGIFRRGRGAERQDHYPDHAAHHLLCGGFGQLLQDCLLYTSDLIKRAVHGDQEAIEAYLLHYDAYINFLVSYDEVGPDGRIYRHTDEDMKIEVQMKLVKALQNKWRKLI